MSSQKNSAPGSKADSEEECRYCVETLYCKDCMKIICDECLLRSHYRHGTSDVERAAEGFRKELEEAERELPECLSAYRDKRIRLEDETARFMRQVEKLEREIKKRGRELKKLVEEHVASLVSQLNTFKDEVIKDVEEEKEEMERHKEILEGYRQRCAEISAPGRLDSRDICRRMRNLDVRSAELKQLRRSILCGQISSPGVTFEKRELSEFLEINGNANIVGKIAFRGDRNSSEFIRMMADNEEDK